MKSENKKFAWAVGLVAGVGALSIAYAALSTTLNINGNGQVNSGTVQFVQDTSKAYSIGTKAISSSDSAENPNPTTKLDSEFAKSLGKAGTVTVSTGTETGAKENDTVTITGTEIYDFDAYVLYKLDIKNTAPNTMKLKELPQIEFSEGSGYVDATIYTDEKMLTLLQPYNDEEGSTNTSPNYLPSQGTTTWYLKVFHYGSDSIEGNLSSRNFSFSVKPIWEYA